MAINDSSIPLPTMPSVAEAAPHADTLELRFAVAIERFETGQWQQAFGELVALANRGHAPAARIASMLVRRGTSMFGGPFRADPADLARWQQIGG
jgi:hypothetical protein